MTNERARKPLTEDQKAEIDRWVRYGLTVPAIANVTKIPYSQVRYYADPDYRAKAQASAKRHRDKMKSVRVEIPLDLWPKVEDEAKRIGIGPYALVCRMVRVVLEDDMLQALELEEEPA